MSRLSALAFVIICLYKPASLGAADPPKPTQTKKPPPFIATLQWRIPNVSYSWGTPAFYKDYVIFGNSKTDEYRRTVSTVQMHRIKDGSLVWQQSHFQPRRENLVSSEAVNGPFCVVGNHLYYQAGNGELVCVDLDESILADLPCIRWSVNIPKVYDVFKRDSSGERHSQPGPVVADGVVCICTGNGSNFNIGLNVVSKPRAPSFMAFDALTGQLKWSSSAPGSKIMIGQWASPVIYNDGKANSVIFCGGDGLLYRFELATGKKLMAFDANLPNAKEWTPHERGDRLFASMAPAIDGNKAYVAMSDSPQPSGRLRSFIAAIDLKEKNLLWRYMFTDDRDNENDYFLSTPVVHDGVVYALSYRSLFVAIDQASGRELWSDKRPRGDISAGGRPVFWQDQVWAPTSDDMFRFGCGRKLASCEKLEVHLPKMPNRFEIKGDISGTPAFRPDYLVFFAADELLCVRIDR